jgi:hypothetical protein
MSGHKPRRSGFALSTNATFDPLYHAFNRFSFLTASLKWARSAAWLVEMEEPTVR